MNKAYKKYMRQVRDWLPGTRKLKNRIMANINASVEGWLDENPDAGYAQLEAQFGKPEQIAAAYVDNTGAEEILRDLHIKKKILRTVVAGVLVAVLIWAAAVSIAVIDAHKDGHGIIIATQFDAD